jgi:hypothetical protein
LRLTYVGDRACGVRPNAPAERNVREGGKVVAYTVEIMVNKDDLPNRMNQMRVWLDHQRYFPRQFRVFDAGNQSTRCRVYFEADEEAAAFARQFDGRVLNPVAVEAML